MNRFRTSEMGSTFGRGGVFRMLSIVDMIVTVYVFTISELRKARGVCDGTGGFGFWHWGMGVFRMGRGSGDRNLIVD